MATTALLQRLGTENVNAPAVGMEDAGVRRDLETIERTMALLGTPAFPVNGIQSLQTVCGALSPITVRYILSDSEELQSLGRTSRQLIGMRRQDPRIAALVTRNSDRFQEEMAILASSIIRCNHAHLPVVVSLVRSAELTPALRTSLRGLRNALLEMIINALTEARQTTMRPENKRKYFDAMTQTVDGYVAIMPLSMRNQIRAQIQTLPPVTDAEGIAIEQTVLTALQSTQCTGLCLIE